MQHHGNMLYPSADMAQSIAEPPRCVHRSDDGHIPPGDSARRRNPCRYLPPYDARSRYILLKSDVECILFVYLRFGLGILREASRIVQIVTAIAEWTCSSGYECSDDKKGISVQLENCYRYNIFSDLSVRTVRAVCLTDMGVADVSCVPRCHVCLNL